MWLCARVRMYVYVSVITSEFTHATGLVYMLMYASVCASVRVRVSVCLHSRVRMRMCTCARIQTISVCYVSEVGYYIPTLAAPQGFTVHSLGGRYFANLGLVHGIGTPGIVG